MITTIFSKSRPFNYALVTILLIVCFFLYQLRIDDWLQSIESIGKKAILLSLLIGSLFISNFITKKNGLSKDNTYPFLFFFIFLILFPTTLGNSNLIISNFFILLALRRLISLQSLVAPKEKIFDASFWILLAALFHFWSIFYIVLVFIAIILHVSKDYRNWIIPFIALLAVTILFFLANSLLDNSLMSTLLSKTYISFDFYYFDNVYQRIALAVFTSISLFAFVLHVFDIPNKALNMQSSHKTILFSFILGVGIYVLSANKNNGSLAFCFAPLAIIGANFIEKIENNWVKEIVVYSLLAFGVFFFIMQL